ncbi:gephyrin-like molybdotransferase Glp [Candidatus Palauibacter sp.]|uniref:molybdopterin molybdotransferase MoeA n=1 Tax=Candidatus Palauibacter sp. TaxID=3101350 RepID=UPI003AF2C17E
MSDADWISFEQALDLVLGAVSPLGTERVPLPDALGRALDRRVEALAPHPPWDNSAMDGFAVRADDVRGARADRPVILPISDDIPAGAFPRGPLDPGSAARVMTGAPVPEGATGVVRVEHTDGGPDEDVRIFDDADAERHIRLLGEDVKTGDTLLEPGEELGAAAVALLATAGRGEVEVGRRPRVGVLSNGDELVDLDEFEEVLAGRRIMNSNGHALAAQLAASGADPVRLGIARDDPVDLRRRLERADDCDAIVSAAGVSVGEHDYVKRVLDELGFERSFWRVRMRPGSATVFGTLGGRPFWGVPGNPASALVTFETLVRPAIRKMAGFARPCRRSVTCVAGQDFRGPRAVVSFLRVLVASTESGDLVARLTGPQGSGNLGSMLADGLLALPAGTDTVREGARVRVIPLREWASPTA